ncbi:hypothetical protein BWI17_16050 [Betaproteobacteria bacterium GR16-43]|nr:hypothetical protein BWI17_16050 [Betaproteobacteria bacterium GR16-43]
MSTPTPGDLRRHLSKLRELRGPASLARTPARLLELKRWQQARLTTTYADLAAKPRYAEATQFFLDDLYGPKDFSGRDEAMLRIYPTMVKLLPATAVQTAALAIEVDALSEVLDRRLAAALGAGPIDEASYAKAYRESATPAERERQVALVEEVGHRLDRLVKKPMVLHTIKLMRGPAKLAGLSDLQRFLERGFAAFKAMGGAEEFLATIAGRERRIASRLFSSAPEPFSP